MDKITVFMPVYNCEKYVKDTIDSVLNQSFNEFEFLIIDDGSTDNTLQIIESYSDNRIRLIKNKINKGLPYTRNLGLKLSKYDYIALIDADDICYRDRLSIEYKYLKENKNVVAVYSECDFIINNKIKKNFYINRLEAINIDFEFILRNPVINPSAMFRKKNISYRSECFVAQDYSFWVDLLKFGEIHKLNKHLIAYRIGHDSITKKSIEKRLEERQRVINSIKDRVIEELKFKLDDTEKEIFFKYFSESNTNIEFEQCEKVIKIVKMLIEQNKQSKKFNESSFNNIIIYNYFSKIIECNPKLFFKSIELAKDIEKIEIYNKGRLLLKVIYFLFRRRV